MGCNTCKISEIDSEFFKACKTSKSFVLDFQPLLTLSERNFWLKSLQIKGTPEEDFWLEYNGFYHSCFIQIGKDINRTFPTLPFFSHKTHVTRFQLLLKKFAIYFPKIGYTQGLNFVAGYLLMCGFEDQSAFKIIVSLMVHDKLMAIGLYEDQFLLNKLYCQLFWNLLYLKLPKVAQKIKKAKVQDQIWIFQWFISFFLYSFPTEFVKKFWDFIIQKKQLSMVLIALGIISRLKNDILSMKNPDQFDFLQLFQNTKDLEFCNAKFDQKKIVTFINLITKQQIERALNQTKCLNNPYRKYFLSANQQKNQLYVKFSNQYKFQRATFKANPDPRKYTRTKDSTNQLQNLVLSKYKLYQSDYKRSNVASSIFKMSTFSIAVDASNEVLFLDDVKKQSNIFSNPFFNKINFTQSKVIQNGLDIANFRKLRQLSPSYKRKQGINPFEQISLQRKQSHQTSGNGHQISLNKNPIVFSNASKNSNLVNADFSKKSRPYYTGN